MDTVKLAFCNILDISPREVRSHAFWIVRTELGKTDLREFVYELWPSDGVIEKQRVPPVQTIVVMAAKLPTARDEMREPGSPTP